VFIPRTQQCCGAIHYHSGADQPAMELAATNVRAFGDAHLDAVVVNVAGCGSMLRDYGQVAHEMDPNHAARQSSFATFSGLVRDVSEFLATLGVVSPTGSLPIRACYQDACHLVHAQKVREQPRELLSKIPGLQLIPMQEPEICCGAAGSYNLTEPEMSDRLAQRKLKNILDCRPDVVISGNAGCSMQIQAELKRVGQKIPVLHPMELLDLSYRQLSLSSLL
jgi:glycolate oxidase iron-sulfur subunit